MAYTAQTWVDGNATYPLSAARMTNIENGLVAAAGIADTGHRILTTAQRDALSAVTVGTMIWNSTVNAMQVYIGTGWSTVGGDLTFANEAARDAAITAPVEGMKAYLTAPTIPAATGSVTSVPTGVETVYNGSVWVCLTEVASTSVTSTTASMTSAYATAWTSGTGDTITNSVTLVTGTTALVHLGLLGLNNSGGNCTLFPAVAVSGATTQAATEVYSVGGAVILANTVGGSHGTVMLTGLTAGTNTFTLNGASIGNASWNLRRRFISVRGIA